MQLLKDPFDVQQNFASIFLEEGNPMAALVPPIQDHPVVVNATVTDDESTPLATAIALFCSVICLQTSVQTKPYPIAVSEKLPHIVFPIGKPDSGLPFKHLPHIRAVFDSGAGLSLGYLPYFQDLHQKFPEFFNECSPIDPDVYQQITVGNIDKECAAATCTYYAEIFAPCREEGRPVTWRFALSPVLAVNALMGLPFIMRARLIPNFADGYVYSEVFQANFALEMHKPRLEETVPQQDGNSTPIFMAAHQDKKQIPTVTVLDPNSPKATSC